MGEITIKTSDPEDKNKIEDDKEQKKEPKPEPKPEYIDFQKVKKINFKDDLDLETNVLLGIKKNNLEYKFHVLEEQTKNQKTIYETQTDKNEGLNNKEILKEGCCCCTMETYLSLNFKLLGPLFVIFHLVGVFQLVNLLESTQNEMMFGLKSFIMEDYNRSSQNITLNNITDIYYQYENLCFKKIPDFNLLFLSSIIGNIFLKGLGYKLSSLIFMAINSAVIIIYNSFDFPKEKYVNFTSVIYIILYYILLYISVGSMALFSQQIYFDGLKKYFLAIYEGEDKIKDRSFFSYLCFTAFPSYFIYIGINYFFKNNYYQNYFLINIYVYLTFTGLSVIVYFFYSFALIKGKKLLKKDVSKRYCRICGYLIYQESKKLKPEKKDISEIKKDEIINNEKTNNNLNENIITKEDTDNKIENEVDENDKIIEKKEDINFKINYDDKQISIKNSFFTISKNHIKNVDYIDYTSKYEYYEDDPCCLSCKLGCRKFFKLANKSSLLSCIFFCDFCKNCLENFPENFGDCCRCKNDCCDSCHECWYDCCKCCDCYYCCDCCDCCVDCFHDFCYCDCCCCEVWGKFWMYFYIFITFPFCICCCLRDCCDRDDINELYQEEETFCYCYKIQNNMSWFCDLLFKNDVLQIIIIDIFLESLTLGFGKIINENLSNNLNSNLYWKNFLIISLYIVYYLIIALFNSCLNCLNDSKKRKKEINIDYIYELTGVTIWNSFIVSIFTGFSAFGGGKFKEFTDNYLILLPYALTKFYYFILINSLVKKMDADNLDLLSNSTIISLFFLIFRIVVSVLVEIIDIKILLIFQFIFGLIVSIIIITLFIILCWFIAAIYEGIKENNKNKNNLLI